MFQHNTNPTLLPRLQYSLLTENKSPIITGNSSINVEVGKTVYMQFNASDDSTKLPKYNLLKQPESFTLNETTGIAKWTPTSTAVSELRYHTFMVVQFF